MIVLSRTRESTKGQAVRTRKCSESQITCMQHGIVDHLPAPHHVVLASAAMVSMNCGSASNICKRMSAIDSDSSRTRNVRAVSQQPSINGRIGSDKSHHRSLHSAPQTTAQINHHYVVQGSPADKHQQAIAPQSQATSSGGNNWQQEPPCFQHFSAKGEAPVLSKSLDQSRFTDPTRQSRPTLISTEDLQSR